MVSASAASGLLPDNKRIALSLCYDGGLPSHLETVAPCLEALGLTATFYAPSTALLDSPSDWMRLTECGHEIGLAPFHDWVADDGTLEAPAEALFACTEDDSRLLDELFGARPRSLGLPIVLEGTAKSRRKRAEDLANQLPNQLFELAVGVRTGIEGPNTLHRLDSSRLRTILALSEKADPLRITVERHEGTGCWLILTFHGVGCGEPAMDAVEHAAFCLWIAENRTTIEVATVSEFCSRIVRNNLGVPAVGISEKSRAGRKR